MGKMKELYTNIQDMLLNGYDHEDISMILGVSRETIREIDNQLDTEIETTYDYAEGRWNI